VAIAVACSMTRIQVNVGFREGVGFESEANHAVTRSFVAESLKELRRKITVATLRKRRKGEDLQVSFALSPAARAEWDRRRGAVGV
jgi:hypothetical protein